MKQIALSLIAGMLIGLIVGSLVRALRSNKGRRFALSVIFLAPLSTFLLASIVFATFSCVLYNYHVDYLKFWFFISDDGYFIFTSFLFGLWLCPYLMPYVIHTKSLNVKSKKEAFLIISAVTVILFLPAVKNVVTNVLGFKASGGGLSIELSFRQEIKKELQDEIAWTFDDQDLGNERIRDLNAPAALKRMPERLRDDSYLYQYIGQISESEDFEDARKFYHSIKSYSKFYNLYLVDQINCILALEKSGLDSSLYTPAITNWVASLSELNAWLEMRGSVRSLDAAEARNQIAASRAEWLTNQTNRLYIALNAIFERFPERSRQIIPAMEGSVYQECQQTDRSLDLVSVFNIDISQIDVMDREPIDYDYMVTSMIYFLISDYKRAHVELLRGLQYISTRIGNSSLSSFQIQYWLAVTKYVSNADYSTYEDIADKGVQKLQELCRITNCEDLSADIGINDNHMRARLRRGLLTLLNMQSYSIVKAILRKESDDPSYVPKLQILVDKLEELLQIMKDELSSDDLASVYDTLGLGKAVLALELPTFSGRIDQESGDRILWYLENSASLLRGLEKNSKDNRFNSRVILRLTKTQDQMVRILKKQDEQ